MIRVRVPHGRLAERRWVLSVLLEELLGLDFEVVPEVRDDIALSAGDEAELVVADGLLGTAANDWLAPTSLPVSPLAWVDLGALELGARTVTPRLPALYCVRDGEGRWARVEPKRIWLGLDLFGSAFFMLSRYEEVVLETRDRFDRFPATASTAFREGFLDRPVVNEYAELLWSCLERLWPNLRRREHRFRVCVSHDVDHPARYAFRSGPSALRVALADARRASGWRGAVATLRRFARVRSGVLEADPNYTFEALMDLSEALGLVSTFFFFGGRSSPAFDARYSLEAPAIRALLRRIDARGHRLGLHGSFETYRDAGLLRAELAALRGACREEGLEQPIVDARQHYLRWRTPDTFRALESAGVAADHSLGYADCAGFRAGICTPYTTFDLGTGEALALREHPLVVMECSVLDAVYMGLPAEGALLAMRTLRERCRRFGGEFTLLWHNSRLQSESDWALYRAALSD